MIKDEEYFLRFDLASAAVEIRSLGTGRGASDAFGDAITAVLTRSEREDVSEEFLVSVLGEPDRVRDLDEGTVFEYDWSDYHGPTLYTSTTPFLVIDGKVLGLAERLPDGTGS